MFIMGYEEKLWGPLQNTDENEIVIPSELDKALEWQAMVLDKLKADGLDDADHFWAHLCLEEAIVNAIKHGNWDNQDPPSADLRQRPLRLSYAIGESEPFTVDRTRLYIDTLQRVIATGCNRVFRVSIQDQGSGFDLGAVPDPTLEQNLEKPSGRGLVLMRYGFDTVQHEDGGRLVRMAIGYARNTAREILPVVLEPQGDTELSVPSSSPVAQ